MDDLIIESVKDAYYIPYVYLNVETGIFEISGESYLEDTREFYQPIIDWIKEYTVDTSRAITFNIKLTYYNTSSSRSILDILLVLKEFEDKGGDVTVNWYHSDDDMDLEEEVEDFEIDTQLKINLIPFDEE